MTANAPQYQQLVKKLGQLEKEVAECKHANRQLRESEKKYQQIFSASREHMSRVDKNYVYQAVNDAYLQAFNKKRTDIVGHGVADILGREVFESVVKPKLDQAFAGKAVHYGYWFDFPASGRRFMEVAYWPLRDDENRINGIVVNSRDVTKHKMVEEEQKKIRARLASLSNIAGLVDADDRTLGARILAETTALTNSQYAFYGYLAADESVVTTYAWSKQVMEGCQIQQKPYKFTVSEAGIWADAIRQRRVLIINDYPADHPGKKGLPAGHVPLSRILVVPVFKKDRIVAVAAVANKSADYTRKDAKHLEVFCSDLQAVMARRHAEMQLRESRNRLQNLMKSLPVGVSISDAEGRVYEVNEAMIEMFGYDSKEEFLQIPAHQLYADPKQRDRFVDLHRKKKGAVKDFEARFRRKDGTMFWGSRSSTRKMTEAGKTQLISITQNIEARKQAQENFQQAARQNELILNSVGEGICVVDPEGSIIYANPAAAKITGYEDRELIGRGQHGILQHTRSDGRPYPQEDCPLHKTLKDGLYRNVISEMFFRKDGTHIPVEYTTTPIFEKDRIVGAVMVFKDISKRLQAEADLQKSEASLAYAQQIAHLGNWEWDILTGELCGSAEFFRILGMAPRSSGFCISHGEFLNCVHPEDRPALEKYVDQVQNADQPFNMDYRIVLPDNSVRMVQQKAEIIFDDTGCAVRMLGTIQDVTETAKLHRQLRQAQKMEAIGTLAGGIAHDFNNILSSVLGYTELSLDIVSKDSKAYDNLQAVLKAGLRAKDLVKQILTFSRQGGQAPKPVQVKLIVKEALKLLKASLPATIEIRTNIQSDSLVLGDSTQIHQVIMNICTNASHAMGGNNGILAVALEDVMVDAALASRYPGLTMGPHIKLSISDNGCGIPAEAINRIFDPFYTTKEKSEGTGLGLSVVHGIVKNLQGDITVYSEAGEGTRFDVYLPVLETESKKEIEFEQPLPMGYENLLFVDDEPTLVKMETQVLTSLGYTVTSRTSGLEALELFKAKAGQFDLVITDMTMPKISGLDLAIELIRIRPDIPIIVCTGFSAQIDEKKAKAAGVRALISKPVLKRDLAETIRNVLEGQIASSN